MYQLIANRLLRQFQQHNVQHAAELFAGFGQWAAFASGVAGSPLSPVEAARKRCARITAGVKRIHAHGPPDLPFLAGWFVDTHVPLFAAAPASVYETYRRKLAPEQQGGFPVVVGPPFRLDDDTKEALEAAWLTAGAQASTLAKLLGKGTSPPVSIRYIGPQCIRAMRETPAGMKAVSSMIVAGRLKAFPHSRPRDIPWRLEDRAEAYSLLKDECRGVEAVIAARTARQLFAAVCEYVVALTSQHPSLWRAVSCTPGGLRHIRSIQNHTVPKPRPKTLKPRPKTAAAGGGNAPRKKSKAGLGASAKIPSDITRKCTPAGLRAALLAETPQEARKCAPALNLAEAVNLKRFAARHQAPLAVARLAEPAACIQREAVQRATGIKELLVAVCKTCTVIHRKIKDAPAPIKKRSGASTLLLQDALAPGQCAACGTSGTTCLTDAVGAEIRARVRHSDPEPLTLMVCGSCGALAAGTVDLMGAPRCRPCASKLKEAPWPARVVRTCLCGGAAACPATLIKVRTAAGGVKLLPACHKHAALSKHIPPGAAVPVKWLSQLFRSRGASKHRRGAARNRHRRLTQYCSARRFSHR